MSLDLKAAWQRQARRIDAMSLRERALLFGSLAVAMAAATDALLIAPRMAEQKAIAERMRQQTRDLDALRRQQAGADAAAADTPQGKLARALNEARAERARMDAQLAQADAAGTGVTRLPELLERVLRRHERLTLVSLATAREPARKDGAAPSALQGVDLSVSGSYPDLLQYLGEVERTLPGLRWGELRIGTATQPPLLTVRLFMRGET